MPILRFVGQATDLRDGETVLEGLLKAGHRLPHSCRAGACQSCLIRAESGPVPEAAQAGLNAGLKAQGFFLACVARPRGDLVLDRGDGAIPRVRARLASIERMGVDVLRVRIEPESGFAHRPGQFLTLIRGDGLSRSYSIASLPEREGHLE